MFHLRILSFLIEIKKKYFSNHSLEIVLKNKGKNRWLDIGCGGNFAPNFYYLDFYADVKIPDDCKNRYFRMNILEITNEDCEKVGKFDLIRLQHVFEHFTPEEGEKVLKNCSRLLNPEGYILITVPDLKKFVNYYKTNRFKELYTFYNWSLNRINKNAPASYFFSIYSHSLIHEQHKWCYDYKGLEYAVNSVKIFKNIRQLKLHNTLSSIPFSHNRPLEDVCVIANLK